MVRLIVASLCILVLATTLGEGAPSPNDPIAFHRIVMMWPKAFCHISTTRCTKTPPERFTMHGVWPSFGEGTSKSKCSGAPAFNTRLIDPIIKNMEYCWPSYVQANDRFWKHEWEEHGSCSGMSLLDYFTKGVNQCLTLQALHLSISTAFSNKRIVPGPSKTYVPTAYYDALVSHFGVTPQLRCKEKVVGTQTNKYLYEVVFCVDLNFNPVNCPRDQYLSGCGPIGGGGPSRTPIYFI